MTTIYFIRHAESDTSVRNGRIRPLTEKGMKDRTLVTTYLDDKIIDVVLSSPFKRAVDTVADFANKYGLDIEMIEDFRERQSDSDMGRKNELFNDFLKQQWENFNYTYSDGECLVEVQKRNISALDDVLKRYENKNIVIGTHATALCTIINYFDKTFNFNNFTEMVDILPWVVKMDFDENGCIGMEKIDLFKPDQKPDYSKCVVRTANIGELKGYRFVVIFARYQNKWLYCKAKTRDCYETAGGHIEDGETPLQAAKRELYEETGAVKFDITPVFDYSVHLPTVYSNGQVFFAQIYELDELPNDFEMAEVELFDSIPDIMRFPQILPVVYERLQGWLNLQSAKDEIWDVYDENRNLTGRTHRRADPLTHGDYHLVVHVWIQNSKGEFLITKRAPNKGFPNMWECTGGSAVSGDDSVIAAIREVKEETGLTVLSENGRCIFTLQRDDSICDVWLFRQDFDISDVVLQENETTDVKYVTKNEVEKMIENGEFIAFHYIDKLFEQC